MRYAPNAKRSGVKIKLQRRAIYGPYQELALYIFIVRVLI